MNSRDMVEEFFRAFGDGDRIADPGRTASFDRVDDARVELRMDLIAEEFGELVGAVLGAEARTVVDEAWQKARTHDTRERDIVETADASGDLTYVILGLDIETGIPTSEVFAEIHRSNMSKLGEDGSAIYSDGTDGKPVGKIVKGPHFFRPDIQGVLEGGASS